MTAAAVATLNHAIMADPRVTDAAIERAMLDHIQGALVTQFIRETLAMLGHTE